MRWLDRFFRKANAAGSHDRHDTDNRAIAPPSTGAGDRPNANAVSSISDFTLKDAVASRSAADRMEEALAAAKTGEYQTALALWEPLARAGNARAQNNIGACFAEGLGVPSDRPLALKWLTLSAQAGDPVGQRNCAAFHMRGSDATGSDADPAKAAILYRQAAEQGDAEAQDMLSWLLLEGEIIPPDPVEARLWAERAAEGGNAASMTRLGMLYHNALGVERDPRQAVTWWRKGAERGDADAQAMLGAACHMGTGTPIDRVAALAWLLRAIDGGSALAQPFLRSVRDNLSPVETAEAERRANLPLAEMIALLATAGGGTP